MISGDKSYTPAGNVHSPSKLLCCRWVKQAWSKVSTEVIIKSFQVCGISVSVNGSQDNEIHCTKDGEVAVDARHEIQRKTQALHMPINCDGAHDNEHNDPFAGIMDSDKEETETNEIFIEDV